jgi:hypothetical protein
MKKYRKKGTLENGLHVEGSPCSNKLKKDIKTESDHPDSVSR